MRAVEVVRSRSSGLESVAMRTYIRPTLSVCRARVVARYIGAFVTFFILAGISAAQKVKKADPDSDVQSLYADAKAAQAQGDLTTAAVKYESILRADPGLAPAYNNLGSLY